MEEAGLGVRFTGGSRQRAWAEMTWRAIPSGVGCDGVAVVVGMWAAMYNVPRGSSIVALGCVGKMLGSQADFLDLIQCEDE